MRKDALTVEVKIDAGLFRSFALFDTLRRQRRWVSPAVFAGIMLVFACVCFAMRGRAEQAGLLGGVLLAVGLVLPAAYFLSFYLSIRTQIKKLKLTEARHVYTVTLRPETGVEVATEQERASYRWDELYGAWRVKNCVYLYAAPRRAYLLPDGQVEGGADRLWALLQDAMPPQRLHDHEKGGA